MTSDLRSRAEAVLDGNWTGGMTRPGPHLYPHQWSWDSAFVAIGNARRRPDRAREELRSLFRGQWHNGMLPHIVFTREGSASAYFPGPEAWQTELSPNAPEQPRTSGVVQPPLHATAAWRIHEAMPNVEFLDELFPRLCAWHEYLHRERDPAGDGLIAIRHPWESGQDDSAAWDEALQAIPVREGRVRRARRADLAMIPADERPTLADYDEYLTLVDVFKQARYDEARLCEACPFLVADPLFNALLVQAEEDLGRIASALGEDAEPCRARGARTRGAMERWLWDDQQGLYEAYNLRTKRRIDAPVAAGFVALFAGVPDEVRGARLAETLIGPGFWPGAQVGHPVPSLDRRDPRFEARRYWRGPVWVNIDWLVARGLARYGRHALADRLVQAVLELVDGGGVREYFDPDSGEGYGSEAFSWTAALTLELLDSP